MGKLQKQKNRSQESPRLLTTEVLEQKTAIDLDQHNYRRAKEWLKELSRRDKELYQPRLIDCYRKLAGQMLEKGQLNEAKTVFEQIRLLTGRPVDGRLEAQSLTLAEDYHAAALALVGKLGGEEGGPLAGAQGKALADNLVIAFEDIPELQKNHPELFKELLSVRAALENLSAERFADAQNDIKAIGRSSIFADWRLFIKGLCAFYAGDDVKAREALRRFDKDSLLFRAARPFIHILAGGEAPLSKDEAREPLLTDICRILHRPELGNALPRAEYLWYTGRHADSLEHALRMLGDFPTNESGLLRALSRFYFHAHFHMNPDHGEKYLRDLHHIVIKKRPGNDVARLLHARSLNIFFENTAVFDDHDLVWTWEEFLTLHQRVSKESSRLRALVYAHLGDLFAMDSEDQPAAAWFGGQRRKTVSIRNFDLAEEAYEKSLAIYREDKDIHIKLLNLYEKVGDDRKRNRKLDEISKLFPDDKDILIKNGNYCVERKSYLKGIEYLKRAVALDPLSRINREALGVAYIKASLHFARGKATSDVHKNPLRYREFMKEALEMGDTEAADMTLGRPYLQIRQAIFEWMAGRTKEGDLLFAEALKNGNENGRLSYFAYMISRAYEAPLAIISRLESAVKPFFAALSPSGVAAFADVIKYIRLIVTDYRWWLDKESKRLKASALKAAGQPCSPDDAEKIIRCSLAERWNNHLVHRYANKILREDPKSPLFLYFLYMQEHDDSYRYDPPTRNNLQKLKDIREIAVERNQRLLVNLLAQEIRRVEELLLSPRERGYYHEDDSGNEEDQARNIRN